MTRHRTDAVARSRAEDKSMTPSRLAASEGTVGDEPGSGQMGTASDGTDKRTRLLVVDDDPRVRAAIGQTVALEADLVIVAAVGDAPGALAWAERSGPAVALVDALLRDEVTGLALVRSLGRVPGCAVVAMSARSGLRQAALDAGAVAFVEKGSDIDAILDAVRAAAPPHHL
jgi:DNA-binding NtrC family response regulator